MGHKFQAVLAAIAGAYWLASRWWAKVAPIIEPLVKRVEQAAIDGDINLADRKAIAMGWLNDLQTAKIIKLNFIEKIIIGKVVDVCAERLPNIRTVEAVDTMAVGLKK